MYFRVNNAAPEERKLKQIQDKWGNVRAFALAKSDAQKKSLKKTGKTLLSSY